MAFKKKVKLYNEIYKNIVKDNMERFLYLIDLLKIKDKEIEYITKKFKALQNIKTTKVKFIFYMFPEPTPRPRSSGFGSKRHFYVKNSKDYSNLVKDVTAELDNLEIIHTGTEFEVISYLPIPSSMNRFEKLFAELGLIKPLVMPDWDNLGKTYSDMIQGHLLLNDSIITDGISRLRYSCKPRVEINMNFQQVYDCKFNKKVVESSKKFKELNISTNTESIL